DGVDPHGVSIVVDGVVVDLCIAVGVQVITTETDAVSCAVVNHIVADDDPMCGLDSESRVCGRIGNDVALNEVIRLRRTKRPEHCNAIATAVGVQKNVIAYSNVEEARFEVQSVSLLSIGSR